MGINVNIMFLSNLKLIDTNHKTNVSDLARVFTRDVYFGFVLTLLKCNF